MTTKYIHWVNMNTFLHNRSFRGEIDPGYLANIHQTAIIPISHGETVEVLEGTGFTAAGAIERKASMVTVYDEGVAIATIIICLHSRKSKNLWKTLHKWSPTTLATTVNEVPPVPWCALRLNINETVPEWLETFSHLIAWAIVEGDS